MKCCPIHGPCPDDAEVCASVRDGPPCTLPAFTVAPLPMKSFLDAVPKMTRDQEARDLEASGRQETAQ